MNETAALWTPSLMTGGLPGGQVLAVICRLTDTLDTIPYCEYAGKYPVPVAGK